MRPGGRATSPSDRSDAAEQELVVAALAGMHPVELHHRKSPVLEERDQRRHPCAARQDWTGQTRNRRPRTSCRSGRRLRGSRPARGGKPRSGPRPRRRETSASCHRRRIGRRPRSHPEHRSWATPYEAKVLDVTRSVRKPHSPGITQPPPPRRTPRPVSPSRETGRFVMPGAPLRKQMSARMFERPTTQSGPRRCWTHLRGPSPST